MYTPYQRIAERAFRDLFRELHGRDADGIDITPGNSAARVFRWTNDAGLRYEIHMETEGLVTLDVIRPEGPRKTWRRRWQPWSPDETGQSAKDVAYAIRQELAFEAVSHKHR